MNIEKSQKEFKRACECMPGGVNSPVRAFGSVKGEPVLIDSGKGAVIKDIDGNEYIDFVCSWGPLILGHAEPSIIEAIKAIAEKGTSFGASTVLENELAELIIEMVPSIEMVRMVNSGTEAAMSALRLSRGYTNRNSVIKFAGCYHGHGDSFLVKAGSGALTFGVPNSPGVTEGTVKDTLLADYNNLESVEALFKDNKDSIAAIIVEPVAGNMGVIPPAKGFLQGLRDLCNKYGALLIFDEVITGFRLAPGGAQEKFGVMPDVTILGKIIGGGLPVGAYGASKEIMEKLAPLGPVYQAGTLSGNPLAMAAGLAMLRYLKDNSGVYDLLEEKAAKMQSALESNLLESGIKGKINRVASMMTLFFTDKNVDSFSTVMDIDTEIYSEYFRLSLEAGIYLAPSQFEASFVSTAHTNDILDKASAINLQVLKELKKIKG